MYKATGFSVALLFIALVCGAGAGQSQPQGDDTTAKITRLPPTAFKQLPHHIVRFMQAQGCTIPQTYASHKPHNVIRGHFATPGQRDWAALCSQGDRSAIWIFWRGARKRLTKIAETTDDTFLQDTGQGLGYSRFIHPVGKKYITDHSKAYGGPQPPPIDHDGIDDAFIEKGSTVWYYYRGTWRVLQGAD